MVDESGGIGGVLAKRRNRPMKGSTWARGTDMTLLSSRYPPNHLLTTLTAAPIGNSTISFVSSSVQRFNQTIMGAHPCAALGRRGSLTDCSPASPRTRFNAAFQPLCG